MAAAGFFLWPEAMMSDKGVGSLSIRACRLQDVEGVLELWRQGGYGKA
jgi:hypothetical protein